MNPNPLQSSPHPADPVRGQIRSSSLLLGGRLGALGVSLVSQVLLVRYLATSDYGAWTYALAVVTILHTVAALGLDRAATRFLPIFHERQLYGKLLGTIVLMAVTVACMSGALIILFYAAPQQVAWMMDGKQEPLALLSILIFLVPFEAMDVFLVGFFASFGKSRAIFFRRYVLAPGLKLITVLLLIGLESSVTFLAFGYVAASAVAVLIYGILLARLLRRMGLLERAVRARMTVPVREIFTFTFPLMTTELVSAFVHSSGALLLGYFYGLEQVALFTVVLPAAALNLVVMRSFSLLYTPTAARLFARGDYAGINDLYWRTAVWMTVLTFPVFAITFSLAGTVTQLFYGERYAPSATFLALLALGNYFNVALGFNALTLKVLGRMRYVVMINLAAAATSLLLNVLLIPHYGPLGAAIATSSTMILHNLYKQTGLRMATGMPLFEPRYFAPYSKIALGALGLLLIQVLVPAKAPVLLAAVALVWLLVVQMTKSTLRITETFPELKRVPVLRTIFA